MIRSFLLFMIGFWQVLYGSSVLAQVPLEAPWGELARAQHEVEFHIFSNSQHNVLEELKARGINENSTINVFDVEPTKDGIAAVPQAADYSGLKGWSIKNLNTLKSSYCLLRFTFNSVATGWILYHFYDLTYLHPLSLLAGAAMAGSLSMVFMAKSIALDHWMEKSHSLIGQYSRYTLISVLYMASIKVAYLSTEMLLSGTSLLTKQLLFSELLGILKGLEGSLAQMLFTFWNAYRKKNRDAAIKDSIMLTESQKQAEHSFQKVLSTTYSFWNSIVNNTVSLMMNATSSPTVEWAGYGLILTGAGLYLKESISRLRRLQKCAKTIDPTHY